MCMRLRTPHLRPLPFVQGERRKGQTEYNANLVCERNESTVALTKALRSVMLVTQTAARLPSDQNLPLERCECELFLLLPSNFLGAPTRHAEVQTVGGSLVRRRLTVLIALLKNFFAALVERVAATVLHALKQRLH